MGGRARRLTHLETDRKKELKKVEGVAMKREKSVFDAKNQSRWKMGKWKVKQKHWDNLIKTGDRRR